MKSLLIAVDGGGSGTRLWVLDEGGRVVSEGRGGPSAVMAVGMDRAARSVAEAAREAGVDVGAGADGSTRSDAGQGSVALVAITMSGVDREPENSQIRERIQRLFPKSRVVVEHDATGALLAGTLGEPGALLLSGTGSISLSIGGPGEYVRVGGWGYLIDDVGSGYWIGLEAFRRALRGDDGRGPKTTLSEMLRDATGVATILDLIGPVHGGKYDRTAIARWAPLVLKAADDGDEVAEAILQEAATELALLVGTVIRRAPWLKAGAGQSTGQVGRRGTGRGTEQVAGWSAGQVDGGDAEQIAGQFAGRGDGQVTTETGTNGPETVADFAATADAPGAIDARVPIVTAGGVFAMGPTWRERVYRAITRDVPEGRLSVWVRNPLVGAAYVALRSFYESRGEAIPPDVMKNLEWLRAQHSEPFGPG